MDRSRRHEATSPAARTAPASAGEGWCVVKRWPRLSGEAKLAWLFLWERAGGCATTVHAHACDVGGDQGVGDRSGRRALETLASHGLVHVIDRREGVWTLFINEPADVRVGRRVEAAGQAELFGDEPFASAAVGVGGADVSTAVVAQQPPSLLTFEERDNYYPSPSPLERADQGKGARDRGGCCAQTAAAPIAMAAEAALSRILNYGPGEERFESRVTSLVARIDRDVAGVDRPVALKVAHAVVAGELPAAELDQALAYVARKVRAGESRAPAGGLFFAVLKRAFARHGLRW